MTTSESSPLKRSVTMETVPEESAERWGNKGIDVLSTPAILGRIEQICDAAMKPAMAAGEMTVGVSVDMYHRAPERVGNTVTYRVEAPAYAQRVEFQFEVVGADGTLICEGRHRRAVINAEDFKKQHGL